MTLKILLFPLASIYNGITILRNFLYRKGILRSVLFDVYTISVGNLTVGGTGKTPFVEYLVRLFQYQFSTAVLSRGYGRTTKGFRLAQPSDSAKTIGDEPLQIYKKFGNNITVAVGEERIMALPEILAIKPATSLILLDDCYQHQAIGRHFNLLLSDFNRPFYHDYLLPAGNLRESRRQAKRADAVVVTKCPHQFSNGEKTKISANIQQYVKPSTPIFFVGVQYGEPVGFSQKKTYLTATNLLLVSGIAQSQPFEDFAKKNYTVHKHLSFNDHKAYQEVDVRQIVSIFDAIPSQEKAILTTEKDFVKLCSFDLLQFYPVFYVPIEVFWLDLSQKNVFERLLLNNISNFTATQNE